MKTAIVLGTFDGLHEGHRAVIKKAAGFFSIAVTFSLPPKSVLTGESQLLILPDDRADRMKQLGINRVDRFDFNQVKNIAPEEFLKLLKDKYNPSRIVCGFNYRFGKNAAGDTNLLESFCKKNNIEFVCVPAVRRDDQVISSTFIRNLLREGKTQRAVEQIYGGFSFKAPVLHGDARGRVLGFPTANQEYPSDLVRVKFGVYISRVTIEDKEYKAVTNIGVRPTYQTNTMGCETFIKDFDGDIYGKEVKTELLSFVRPEQKFDSVESLKTAILNDVSLLD